MGRNKKSRRVRKLLRRLNISNRKYKNEQNNETEEIVEEIVEIVEEEIQDGTTLDEFEMEEENLNENGNIKVTKEDEFRYRLKFPRKEESIEEQLRKKTEAYERRKEAEYAEEKRKMQLLKAISKLEEEQEER